MKRTDVKIALLTPTYNRSGDWGSAYGALLFPSRNYLVRPVQMGHSALCHNFNNLLNAALNDEEGFTHVAMLHTDVIPEPGWLDKLYEIKQAYEAFLVSVVIPIKTNDGFTSTGIGSTESRWRARRFTMKEVFDMPETFDPIEAGCDKKPLLVNTGCWLADLRHPFWTECNSEGIASFSFEQRNQRRKLADGQWVAEFEPEDWQMSKAIHAAGYRYVATRAVKAQHAGEAVYSNTHVWGRCETDPVAKELTECRS